MCNIKTFEHGSKLNHGQHTCLFFDEFSEYSSVCTTYIKDGLLLNEVIIAVVDEYDTEDLIRDLNSLGLNTQDYIKRGQLIISNIKNTYRGSNSFDPEATLKHWKSIISKYKEAEGIRIMGEATFSIDGQNSTFDKLITYEILVNRDILPMFDRHQYLCIYNKSLYPQELLKKVIKVHTQSIHKNILTSPNPYYIQPEKVLTIHQKEMEIEKTFGFNKDFNPKESYDGFHSESERMDYIMEGIGNGIWVYDVERNSIYLNEFAQKIIHQDQNSLSYQEALKLVHPDDQTVFNTCMDSIIDGKSDNYIVQYRFKISDTNWIWLEDRGLALSKNEHGKTFKIIGVIRDITQQMLLKDEILTSKQKFEHFSYSDWLTGLNNRRHFETIIDEYTNPKHLPLTAISADVNNLKTANDAFGHAYGDTVLKEVAQSITSVIGSYGYAARWGGDEFIILLPNTAKDVVDRIIKSIKTEYLKNHTGPLLSSIAFGYSVKTTEKELITYTISKAEDSMYQSKLLERESNNGKVIDTIIRTLHEKNPREEEHSKRVSKWCLSIGKALDLPGNECKKLEMAGLVHDIGKIAITDSILEKNGSLTKDEWTEIKNHPEIGYRILMTSNKHSDLATAILYHHERLDGKGYPRRKKAPSIPLMSRVIAIADAYDAMTSDRPYRKALSKEVAISELIKNSGSHFDKKIVDLFVTKVLNK